MTGRIPRGRQPTRVTKPYDRNDWKKEYFRQCAEKKLPTPSATVAHVPQQHLDEFIKIKIPTFGKNPKVCGFFQNCLAKGAFLVKFDNENGAQCVYDLIEAYNGRRWRGATLTVFPYYDDPPKSLRPRQPARDTPPPSKRRYTSPSPPATPPLRQPRPPKVNLQPACTRALSPGPTSLQQPSPRPPWATQPSMDVDMPSFPPTTTNNNNNDGDSTIITTTDSDDDDEYYPDDVNDATPPPAIHSLYVTDTVPTVSALTHYVAVGGELVAAANYPPPPAAIQPFLARAWYQPRREMQWQDLSPFYLTNTTGASVPLPLVTTT